MIPTSVRQDPSNWMKGFLAWCFVNQRVKLPWSTRIVAIGTFPRLSIKDDISSYGIPLIIMEILILIRRHIYIETIQSTLFESTMCKWTRHMSTARDVLSQVTWLCLVRCHNRFTQAPHIVGFMAKRTPMRLQCGFTLSQWHDLHWKYEYSHSMHVQSY